MDSASPPSAFRIRDFRLLTQARFLFSFAVQIQAVIVGWQVYEIKRDPLYLGLIGLIEAIPALSLALFAGNIVDRGNPLRILRYVFATSFLSAAILLAVSGPWLPLAPLEKLPWIYVAVFTTGCARGFSQPSLFSLVPQLVPRESLQASSAWITSVFQIASVGGPALGGLLYAWHGPSLAYGVDSLSLICGIASLALIRFAPKPRPAPPAHELPFERLTAGLRYVFAHPLLLSALAMDMFAVLFGGATALLPIYAGEILRIGPWGLGLLRASPAAGAMFSSLFMIRFPLGRGAGKVLLTMVAGFGLSIIAFGVSQVFWISAALLFLSGAFDAVSMVIRSTIVQLCSPEGMRGRISAVNAIFIGSSNEIGAFESGLAAKLMGTVPSVVFGGCMTLVTVALTALSSRKLREMDMSKL